MDLQSNKIRHEWRVKGKPLSIVDLIIGKKIRFNREIVIGVTNGIEKVWSDHGQARTEKLYVQ